MRRAKQDVDGAGAVHLVLLGNYDGERGVCAPHVLQGLRQRHLCVQEDQVHHHAQVTRLPAHRLGVLSVQTHTFVQTQGQMLAIYC